jgi:Uma2 family endonuclease
MSEPALQRPTFDEMYRQIEALPEGVTGEILEPGVLSTMPRPGSPHRFSARRVLRSLERYDLMEGGAGWWFEVEAEIRMLGDLLLVPDISGWRVDGSPAFIDPNPILVPPDWCCEVLSPTTARKDRLKKLPLYVEAGAQWVWLVDPVLRHVEVYASRDGLPALVASAADDDAGGLPPFDVPMPVGTGWKT